MDWLMKILSAVGMVVDTAVPAFVGKRTQVSAIVAAVAPVAGSVACSAYPAACPAIAAVGHIAAALVPVFAGAGLIRK